MWTQVFDLLSPAVVPRWVTYGPFALALVEATIWQLSRIVRRLTVLRGDIIELRRRLRRSRNG